MAQKQFGLRSVITQPRAHALGLVVGLGRETSRPLGLRCGPVNHVRSNESNGQHCFPSIKTGASLPKTLSHFHFFPSPSHFCAAKKGSSDEWPEEGQRCRCGHPRRHTRPPIGGHATIEWLLSGALQLPWTRNQCPQACVDDRSIPHSGDISQQAVAPPSTRTVPRQAVEPW
jgi:hypothetical protein